MGLKRDSILKGWSPFWTMLALIFFNLNCYSQIIFEKGYFITETNERNDCLIKNIDWKNNPTAFAYKFTDSSEILNADIQSVIEFGIYNISKYIKANVLIDRSGEDLTNLSSVRNPVLVEDTVFLKVLVEGQASLYHYEEKNFTNFFYSLNDSGITPLVYKIYSPDGRKILYNYHFRQQLMSDLNCSEISIHDIENLNYYENELERLFVRYNNCRQADYIFYKAKHNRDLFNLNVRPGLNISHLSMNNEVSDAEDADFGRSLTLRAGLEFEIIFPFNKNKWALITEPTFQYYNAVEEAEGVNDQEVEADYKSIELPLGVRHYFYLDDNSRIFVDAAYILDFCFNSAIKYELGWEYEISTVGSLAAGAGYKYKKFSLEARYLFSRNLLTGYSLWSSDYKTVSFIFGYSLF